MMNIVQEISSIQGEFEGGALDELRILRELLHHDGDVKKTTNSLNKTIISFFQ